MMLDIKNNMGWSIVLFLKQEKTYSIPLITNNPDFGSDYDLTGTARG